MVISERKRNSSDCYLVTANYPLHSSTSNVDNSSTLNCVPGTSNKSLESTEDIVYTTHFQPGHLCPINMPEEIKSKVISDEVPIETRQAAPNEEFCLPNTILSMIYDNKDPYENGLTEGKIHCDRNKVSDESDIQRYSQVKDLNRKEPEATSEDPNLTGCPLQVSFDINEGAGEESLNHGGGDMAFIKRSNFKPLTLHQAQNRLNNGVHCQGPVASGGLRKIDWAVCDGQDPRKTLFLGRESWYESNRRLCRLHRVEYAGHIKTSFDATDTLDTRYRHQLELIVKEHEGKLGSKKAKVTKAASATYNLASNLYLGIVEDFDASLHGNRSDPVNQAALTIKWDDPVQVMEKPRTGYNSATICGRVMSGDPRSPCYPIFEELKFIENLINGLDGGVVSWNTDETASDKVITDLKNLLLFCKMQSLSVAYDSSVEDFPIEEVCGERTAFDFLDLLWIVLKNVNSYYQLCRIIGQVVHTLVNDNVRPYIHPHNNTRSACLIRSILKEGGDALRGYDFSETSSQPLEFLVDIGQEKLRRDHIEAFFRTNLMTKTSLAQYLSPFDYSDYSIYIKRLHSLHQLREVVSVLTCDAVVEPATSIQPVLEEILKENCSAHDSPWNFQVQVSGDLVRQLVNKLIPHSWQLQLTSKSDRLDIQTVGNFCLDPPSPFCPDEDVETSLSSAAAANAGDAGDVKDSSTAKAGEDEMNKTGSTTNAQYDKMTYHYAVSSTITRYI